jgi:cytosine/adenosine deaminase-related metal-dependent hydrolase
MRHKLCGIVRFGITAIAFGSLSFVGSAVGQPFDPARGIVLHGTVVTMDAAGTIIHNGNVLVRDGRIVATWNGQRPPQGTEIGSAIQIDLGSRVLIFPGLINLHNHPTYNMLELWPAPSSHVQAALGRPLGTEPYANRYQWNLMLDNASPELRRLVDTPKRLLNSPIGLNLYPEVGKYAEVKAMLGGETSVEGGPSDPTTNNILIRNVESPNFGRDRIEASVLSIDGLGGDELNDLVARMQDAQIDAWIVHLAEGVRDNQRRAGDTFSSRAEFATLTSKGLLTDMTVIIHGNGLEADDFAAMRAAPSVRLDGTGDGLGAKFVWSPLSNLLLYGQTALVYQALQAGIVVSLGTDWSPSGSRNLLDELKVADITLRDSRLLGVDRDLIPSLSVTGKAGNAREEAEIALDKLLVEMVTTNPAKTLRWTQEVGSIESDKFADLVLITRPAHPSRPDLPNSPYRNLIDATEEDVRLVLVNGEPLSGDIALMAALKPDDYEVVTSSSGCFQKAIDVTNPAVPQGTETFAEIQTALRDALNAMGGDNPPPEGGPADDSNTYSYLKAHIPGASALTDAQFRQLLTYYFRLAPNGRLNMEGVQLSPVLVEDDDFYFHLLGGEVFADSGLIADITPPFGLYLANFNHVQLLGNPFIASEYRDRFYEFCVPYVRPYYPYTRCMDSSLTTASPSGRFPVSSRRNGRPSRLGERVFRFGRMLH